MISYNQPLKIILLIRNFHIIEYDQLLNYLDFLSLI